MTLIFVQCTSPLTRQSPTEMEITDLVFRFFSIDFHGYSRIFSDFSRFLTILSRSQQFSHRYSLITLFKKMTSRIMTLFAKFVDCLRFFDIAGIMITYSCRNNSSSKVRRHGEIITLVWDNDYQQQKSAKILR